MLPENKENEEMDQLLPARPEPEASSLVWVGAWYAAPMRMRPAQLEGRTLYQIVHLHTGGSQIRLRLSNLYGEHPLTLGAVLWDVLQLACPCAREPLTLSFFMGRKPLRSRRVRML